MLLKHRWRTAERVKWAFSDVAANGWRCWRRAHQRHCGELQRWRRAARALQAFSFFFGTTPFCW